MRRRKVPPPEPRSPEASSLTLVVLSAMERLVARGRSGVVEFNGVGRLVGYHPGNGYAYIGPWLRRDELGRCREVQGLAIGRLSFLVLQKLQGGEQPWFFTTVHDVQVVHVVGVDALPQRP